MIFFLLWNYPRKESEPEVIYLKHVERQQQQQKIEEERTTKYAAPSFLTPLRDLAINEGEKAHFEANVGPVGDPSMKVEWFFNGQLITASKSYRKKLPLLIINYILISIFNYQYSTITIHFHRLENQFNLPVRLCRTWYAKLLVKWFRRVHLCSEEWCWHHPIFL